jgi:dolichol-phosphate mannosyltransferase
MINELLKYRFIKFGFVGFSGSLVNLAVLYLGQEYLFSSIHPEQTRIHVSLTTAIILATLNNYLWNRHWTWADRRDRSIKGFFVQMGKYYVSCSLSAGFQYIVTILLAKMVHYMFANLSAIILAAVITYLVNHVWTFGAKNAAPEKTGQP